MLLIIVYVFKDLLFVFKSNINWLFLCLVICLGVFMFERGYSIGFFKCNFKYKYWNWLKKNGLDVVFVVYI